MIPVYLHLVDFMSHKESVIDFKQLGSIIFIIGNEDGSARKSNAVGKSTIFHGIEYCIFNSSSSSKKIGKVVRNGAKKCEGTFIFKMSDGNVYKIYRHRSKQVNGVEFYKQVASDWENITCKTPTATDQLILDVLGINKNTFENTSYFKQNDLMNLAKATAEKRKEIISSMLELGPWAKYRELAKSKKEPHDTELAIINRQILELGNPTVELATIQTHYAQLIADKERYSKDLELKEKDRTQKRKMLEVRSTLVTDQSSIDRKYNDSVLFLQETVENIKFIRNSIADNEKESLGLINTIDLDKKKISEKVKKLSELLNSMPEPVDTNKYTSEQNEFAKQSMLLKENKALLKNLMRPLPQDAICPTCTTILNEERRSELIEAKNKRAQSVESEIANIEDLISLSEDNIHFYEGQLLKFNAAKSYNAQLTSEIAELNREIKTCEMNIEKLSERLASLREKEVKAIDAETNARVIYEDAKSAKVALMSQESVLDDTYQLKLELEALNKEISVLNSTIRNNDIELGKISERMLNTQNKIKRLNDCIDKKSQLEYLVRVYESAMFAFSTKGIPFMIINSVLDSIQEETNKVLKLLRPNMQTKFVVDKVIEKSGETQDTLDMKFFVDTNEWDYTELSGGQQGSVALALKFAMAVVNRKRCGADIRMLLLDEVDQPLDEESIDSFYDILKLWSNDMTILVITHNKQLKEKLDNCILVSKKNGVSYASIL